MVYKYIDGYNGILFNQKKWGNPTICDNIDGIPAELFQILKDHAVKVLHS